MGMFDTIFFPFALHGEFESGNRIVYAKGLEFQTKSLENTLTVYDVHPDGLIYDGERICTEINQDVNFYILDAQIGIWSDFRATFINGALMSIYHLRTYTTDTEKGGMGTHHVYQPKPNPTLIWGHKRASFPYVVQTVLNHFPEFLPQNEMKDYVVLLHFPESMIGPIWTWAVDRWFNYGSKGWGWERNAHATVVAWMEMPESAINTAKIWIETTGGK